MFRFGFKNVGFLMTAALVVGACSPLAPSVSKLSNAAAQKTSTTDGSSPSNSADNALISTKSNSLSDDNSLPRTRVFSQSAFQKKWNFIRESKSSFQVPWNAYHEFMQKGSASFSLEQSGITGLEASLLQKPGLRVILVLSSSDGTISSQHLNHAEASLSFNEETLQWDLKLTGPAMTGDPAQDSDAERVQKTVREKLVSIAVAFDASEI